ncbi:hypothetical protein EVAR_7456_1 [Eumeta japonica]|uniref:Uncharacterized protein n=1 Tax=Eumeta variegata TaxID=151549 RepID=A0A4C1V6H2_EUMVA|nr:hypothetical protein EVAR_7456_1 [Eumeta japonica]
MCVRMAHSVCAEPHVQTLSSKCLTCRAFLWESIAGPESRRPPAPPDDDVGVSCAAPGYFCRRVRRCMTPGGTIKRRGGGAVPRLEPENITDIVSFKAGGARVRVYVCVCVGECVFLCACLCVRVCVYPRPRLCVYPSSRACVSAPAPATCV